MTIHLARFDKKAWSFVALTLLILMGFLFVFLSNAKASGSDNERLITIHDKNLQKVIITTEQTVGAALKTAKIEIQPYDSVDPGLDSQLTAQSYHINIYRAQPVLVIDGNVRQTVLTSYDTAKQIASDAKRPLYDEDTTVLSQSDDILHTGGTGLQLNIDRATKFSLVLYGKPVEARTQATTVGEMMKDKQIVLKPEDAVSVPLTTPIAADMKVEIWRNGKQTLNEEQAIAFPVQQIQDADQLIGYKAIKTPGVLGKKNVTFEIEMQNGQETTRRVVQEVVTLQPQQQVEVVGAKYPPVIGPAEVLARINHWSSVRGIDANRVARIAKCESGFNPQADSGYYKGLFQHDPQYWASRAATYGQADASIYDAEAQIIVSTAMMAGGGWSHWGCD